MVHLKYLLILFTSLFFACGAQTNNDEDRAGNHSSKEPEIEVGEDVHMDNTQDLLIEANMNSQLQIDLSKAALNKSSSPKVKELGNQILTENVVIQNNILALAEAAAVDMDPALSLEYVSLLDAIQSYSGHTFDSAFVATIIEEHENDIAHFTKLSTKMENPITREQITKNLEILERHLQAAKDIQAEMKEKH